MVRRRTPEELAAEDRGESWSPSEQSPQSVPVTPTGVARNPGLPSIAPTAGADPSLRDILTALISSDLGRVAPSQNAAQDMAGRLTSIAEMYPAVGSATYGSDLARSIPGGDPWEIGGNALALGLNAAGAGGARNMIKGGLRGKQFPWGEFDPFGWKVR